MSDDPRTTPPDTLYVVYGRRSGHHPGGYIVLVTFEEEKARAQLERAPEDGDTLHTFRRETGTDAHPFTLDRKTQLAALGDVRDGLVAANRTASNDHVLDHLIPALEKLTDVVEALVLAVEIHK